MKLSVEKNSRNCLDIQLHLPSSALLLITAPLQDDCWLYRVALRKDLVLAAVPDFGGVKICLQLKAAAGFHMPYESGAAEILRTFRAHIKTSVPNGKLLEAIEMLQDEVKKWRGA